MSRTLRLGLTLVGAIVLLAVVGPALVGDPDALVARPLEPPSAAHWLGTTGQGQDVLAQLVWGARTTLRVSVLAGAAMVGLGALVGVAGGYLRGGADRVGSLLTQLFLVLPGLPLMVVVAAWLPPGPSTIAVVLALTGWAWNARVLRAATLALRERDFVRAAELAGEPGWRVVALELGPHLLPLLGAALVGATVYALGAQVGLEFLGLGDLDAVTWGTSLYWASNDAALLTGSWWTFVPTGVLVALTGSGLTLIQMGLDELAHPRLRAVREAEARTGRRWTGVTPVLERPRD
ncbi:MAG: ABC transporter permease [Alphaproteobacteria bacterium]|nr:ABC transporter permease [Alphaproteobacteria bacterium]